MRNYVLALKMVHQTIPIKLVGPLQKFKSLIGDNYYEGSIIAPLMSAFAMLTTSKSSWDQFKWTINRPVVYAAAMEEAVLVNII